MRKFVLIFVCHGVFLLSILDVLFKSTVYPDLKSVNAPIKLNRDGVLVDYESGVAKRIVLIVCDGLPAQYLFEVPPNGITNTPFIR